MTKVIGDYNPANSIDGSTNYLLIQPGNSSVAYNKINRNTFLGVSGQPADLTTVQTVQNKVLNNTNTVTLKDTLFTLQDNGDTTKQAQFELSGLSSATTRTYTMPDASTTLVGIGTTQTLTNKTLTSPSITGGTYDNGTITVDSIGGHTSANVVTVAGLQINNGSLNTNNSVITANITDGAVTPAKLQSGAGTGWAWQSWTPTWTNLTVGNGVLSYAKYVQIGKTIIFRLYFTWGTTTSASGTITFSSPVTLNTDYSDFTRIIDSVVQVRDSSATTTVVGALAVSSSTTLAIQVYNASGGATSVLNTSPTAPFTWATSDIISVSGYYEAA